MSKAHEQSDACIKLQTFDIKDAIWHCEKFIQSPGVSYFSISKNDNGSMDIVAYCDATTAFKIGGSFAIFFKNKT